MYVLNISIDIFMCHLIRPCSYANIFSNICYVKIHLPIWSPYMIFNSIFPYILFHLGVPLIINALAASDPITFTNWHTMASKQSQKTHFLPSICNSNFLRMNILLASVLSLIHLSILNSSTFLFGHVS